MSRALKRLMRVRQLMEDMSRAELMQYRAAQNAMQMEVAAEREFSANARLQAWQVLQSKPERELAWHLHIADSERSQQRAERWQQLAQDANSVIEKAQEAYLQERKQRMQVEILLEEQSAARALGENRREQQQVDEWFGMRRGAKRWRHAVEDSEVADAVIQHDLSEEI